MKCERCEKQADATFGSGRFCRNGCAYKRIYSIETKQKIAKSKGHEFVGLLEKNCENCGKAFTTQGLKKSRRRFCSSKCGARIQWKGTNPSPSSIMDLSSRTISKILKRLGKGCSRCGWNEASCDIHHIRGKKIENPDSHSNLTLICPNCHRLAHSGMIRIEEIVSLDQYIGELWRDHYYG